LNTALRVSQGDTPKGSAPGVAMGRLGGRVRRLSPSACGYRTDPATIHPRYPCLQGPLRDSQKASYEPLSSAGSTEASSVRRVVLPETGSCCGRQTYWRQACFIVIAWDIHPCGTMSPCRPESATVGNSFRPISDMFRTLIVGWSTSLVPIGGLLWVVDARAEVRLWLTEQAYLPASGGPSRLLFDPEGQTWAGLSQTGDTRNWCRGWLGGLWASRAAGGELPALPSAQGQEHGENHPDTGGD
jgi:hypothetical protein